MKPLKRRELCPSSVCRGLLDENGNCPSCHPKPSAPSPEVDLEKRVMQALKRADQIVRDVREAQKRARARSSEADLMQLRFR